MEFFFVFFFSLFFFLLRLKYYRRGDSMSEGLEWIQLSNIQRSGNIWACVVVRFLSILNIFFSHAIYVLNLMYPNLFRNEGTEMKFVSFYVWINNETVDFLLFFHSIFYIVMHTFHNCDYILKEQAKIFVFIFKCM